MIEITTTRFYKTGIWCFSIIAIFNLWGYLSGFNAMPWYYKISGLAGIVFNFVLAGFFYYLLSMEPTETELAASDDIDEIIEEISKK